MFRGPWRWTVLSHRHISDFGQTEVIQLTWRAKNPNSTYRNSFSTDIILNKCLDGLDNVMMKFIL